MDLDFALIPFTSGLVQQQAANEIVQCNDATRRFGLTLTQAQALELVDTRMTSLRDNGRIEFGGGATKKIIQAFCDSPYLGMHNYAQTLHELVALFYHYKNETMDLIADDDLIAFMKTAFDGVCQGTIALLADRELYRLAKNLRFGYPANYNGAYYDESEEDGDGTES